MALLWRQSSHFQPLFLFLVFVISCAQTSSAQTNSTTTSAIHKRASESFVIFTAVFSGVYCAILLVLLYQILKHRDRPVMKLAQAPFLAVQVCSAIISSASLFTFIPYQDSFCRWNGLLIRVPMTVLAATLLGRLWRVYSVLSTSMRIGDPGAKSGKVATVLSKTTIQTLSRISNAHLLLRCKCPTAQDPEALRVEVTPMDLTRLLVFLTLPQFLVQFVVFFTNPLGVTSTLTSTTKNADGTVEIFQDLCELHWSNDFGLLYMLVILGLAVFMAFLARNLPAAFNETPAIFNSATISLVSLCLLSLMTTFVTQNDDITPDVLSFLRILANLCVTTPVVWLVTYPKVQMVRKGNDFIISNMLKSTRRASTTGSVVVDVTQIITLNKGQAPPREIDTQVISLKERLVDFSTKSFGRRAN